MNSLWNRVASTEGYIYVLKKYENWEALERCYDLDTEEVEEYLNQLVEDWEIKSWNFWEWFDVPDFDYSEIELKNEEDEEEEDEED
jgi:hypothetical protein